jgi:photosystem II stability/assembly factor-like uncharacterized protein
MAVSDIVARGAGRKRRGRVPWRQWRRRRLPWLVAALACALAAALASLLLPLRANPWQPEGVLGSADFWLAPIETNGFRRKPAVETDLITVALSADGKTALAGDEGAILRSRDGGANWSLASSIGWQLSAVALSADGRIALATGTALQRSSDGGVNWSPETYNTVQPLISVALSAAGETAVAVGWEGTILQSHDGGVNWSPEKSGTADELRSVALSADGNIGVAVGDRGTIVRRGAAAVDWSRAKSGAEQFSLTSVTLSADGTTALTVGKGGSILGSRDSGASWSTAISGTKADLLSVALASDGVALAVGEGGIILRSRDGGSNWVPVKSGTTAMLRAVALTADGKVALTTGKDGTILRSTDGGATWVPMTSGASAHLISTSPSPEGAVAVGSNGTILISNDQGRNWSPATSGTLSGLRSVAMAFEVNRALAVGEGGTILRSANGGANWSPATSGTMANLGSVALAADGGAALAVGDEGTILRSTDGGVNWLPITSGAEANLSSVTLAADGRAALAISLGGTLLRSADGGVTWSPGSLGAENGLTYFGLAGNGRTALAVGNGSTIVRSADSGATWQRENSGTTAELYSVTLVADGSAALSVGQNGTILRSADGGATWLSPSSGTEANLYSVAVAAGGTAALAAGYGVILRSDDGGKTWSEPPLGRAPPRIAWVLWIGSFVALLPAFVALPPEKPPAKNIAQLLATDRPLRKGDLDATGEADELAAQIGSFLRNAQTSPPLTIAITGAWGSGKSSILSRLRDDLVRGRQRPVWFNAWHRQGEESLFAALMQAVRSEAVPSLWSLAGLDVRGRLLVSRVRTRPIRWALSLLLIAGVIGFLIAARWPTTAEALAPLHELPKTEKLTEAGLKLLVVLGWPFTILMAGLMLFSALRDRLSSAGLDPGRLLGAAGRATRWRDLGVQLAFRDRFKEALTEVTTALGRRTLTILIDDLDRCRPDQIAEVLEAINFLTDTDGCFVVFGFARPQVLAGIGLAHREIAAELAGAEDTPATRRDYAEDFLRKLIQIEVPVPRFGAPAAERLVDAASDIAAEPRTPRAWLPALAVLCLLFLGGIGMWAGERLYSIGEEAWNAAPPPPTQTPGLVGIKTAPRTPDLKQPLPPPKEVASSYFYPGETAPLPHWVWFILVPCWEQGCSPRCWRHAGRRRPRTTIPSFSRKLFIIGRSRLTRCGNRRAR